MTNQYHNIDNGYTKFIKGFYLMLPIVVLLAPSRSGKDSLTELLLDKLAHYGIPGENFKFAGHVKRVTELTYGLPVGSLDDNVTRHKVIPGTTITYLDVLVSLFHNQDTIIDKQYWKRPAINYLQSVSSWSKTLICTDVRDIFEAGFITQEQRQNGRPIILVKLIREGTEGLTSDKHLDANFNYLASFSKAVHTYTLADDRRNFISNLVPIANTLADLIAQ